MTKKLYVGNLPYSFTETILGDTFAPFGKVISSRLITDRETGRSKGFGFVEMSSPQEADDAISSLNGSDVEGRALTVNEARPQPAFNRGSF